MDGMEGARDHGLTVGAFLARWAAETPERLALDVDGERW